MSNETEGSEKKDAFGLIQRGMLPLLLVGLLVFVLPRLKTTVSPLGAGENRVEGENLSREVIVKLVDVEEINSSLICSAPKQGSPLLDRFLGRGPRIQIANLPARFRLEQVFLNFDPELGEPDRVISATLHIPYEFSDMTAQDHAFSIFNENRPPLFQTIQHRSGQQTLLTGNPEDIIRGEAWLQLAACPTSAVSKGRVTVRLSIATPSNLSP